MFLTDIILIAGFLTLVLAWTWKPLPWRPLIWVVAGMSGVGAGLASYMFYRTVALPLTAYVALLFLAGVFLFWKRPALAASNSGWRPIGGLVLLTPGVLATLPMLVLVARVEFPESLGNYQVGVREGIVSDQTRGQSWDVQSNTPRRILVRVWYPSAPVAYPNEARRWSAEQLAVSREFFAALQMEKLAFVSDGLASSFTRAFEQGPPASGQFPLLLFSHGYMGDVATNSFLMTHLASQGYIVASISHPGETSALIYPDRSHFPLSPNAGTIQRDRGKPPANPATFMRAVMAGDIQARSDYVSMYLDRAIVRQRAPIWIDDYAAVLDAIEAGLSERPLGEVFEHAELERVGYIGMSMGALAGPGACHLDSRCDAAVALDVGSGMEFLRDVRSRVPVLVFSAGHPARLGGQDFFYEPNASAGQDRRIHRFSLMGASHWDFTDFALLLRPWARAHLPVALFGTDPGMDLLQAQNRFISDFLDTYLKGEERHFPHAALNEHPVALLDDLSALREWAR